MPPRFAWRAGPDQGGALPGPQDARGVGLQLPNEHPPRRVLNLGQLDFLAGKENVVLLGPPGTGKTHLAIALGTRACLAGQRVAFATATEWVAKLGEAKRQGGSRPSFAVSASCR